MKAAIFALAVGLGTCQFFSPFAASLPAYNSFYDGAVGSPETFGSPKIEKKSVFTPEFGKEGGIDEIYKLDSSSPLPTRVGEFNNLIPFYNPAGVSRFDWVPHGENFMSPAKLGTYAYDINEPRYSQLYKSYYKFFNTDLGLKQAMMGDRKDHSALANDKYRREKNPGSFVYRNSFFDKFPENESIRGKNLRGMTHKDDFQYKDISEMTNYISRDKLDRIDSASDEGGLRDSVYDSFDLSDDLEMGNSDYSSLSMETTSQQQEPPAQKTVLTTDLFGSPARRLQEKSKAQKKQEEREKKIMRKLKQLDPYVLDSNSHFSLQLDKRGLL